jgi:hypothetical protein
MLTERQFPWTENYGLPIGPYRSKGPTAEACKRFFGRLGYIEWNDYDRHWNIIVGDAMRKYKSKHGLPSDPSYGKLVWAKMRAQKVPAGRPNAGEYCFDFYARKIVQDEAKVTSDSDDMALVQFHIRDFWLKAMANEPAWHYSQARAFKVDVDPKAKSVFADCSATPVIAVRYAGNKAGVEVIDPAKQNFSGFGNTDQFEDDWPKIGSPYRIGDLAHFHSERHVIQCIKEGNIDTAEWGSNGWEGAPELVKLRSYSRFPDEFMFVVRPPLVKEAV